MTVAHYFRTVSFILSLGFAFASSKSCSDIVPSEGCVCTEVFINRIGALCTGLSEPNQVKSALEISEDIFALSIQESALPSLPVDLGPHQVRILEIINTTMPYLSPPTHETKSAFDHLKHLSVIKLFNVVGIEDWDWTKLRVATRLTSLSIHGGALNHIPRSFGQIGGGSTLETLDLFDCGLRSIAEGGLAIQSLKRFTISFSPLENLRVDMFARDSKVEEVSLRGMPNVNIETDVFRSMKNLKYLTIDTTTFPAFTEKHFDNANIEKIKLITDFGDGVKTILCDCKYKWILQFNLETMAVCRDPRNIPSDMFDFLRSC